MIKKNNVNYDNSNSNNDDDNNHVRKMIMIVIDLVAFSNLQKCFKHVMSNNVTIIPGSINSC